jgi:hypothetical protein
LTCGKSVDIPEYSGKSNCHNIAEILMKGE